MARYPGNAERCCPLDVVHVWRITWESKWQGTRLSLDFPDQEFDQARLETQPGLVGRALDRLTGGRQDCMGPSR